MTDQVRAVVWRDVARGGTNRWARWAAIFGVLGVVPLALGFGVTGMVQTFRTGQRGLRLALFGVVASVVWTVVVLGAMAARA